MRGYLNDAVGGSNKSLIELASEPERINCYVSVGNATMTAPFLYSLSGFPGALGQLEKWTSIFKWHVSRQIQLRRISKILHL